MNSERFQLSKRLVLVNSASSVATRVLSITVLLWAYQFLIKKIDPEEFAVYPVVSTIMVGAPLFFVMFSSGVNRYIVDAHVRGSDEEVTEVASSVMPMLVLATVAFLAAGAVLALNIEHLLNIPATMLGEARVMLLLLMGSFALRMLVMPYEAAFYVRQRFVELNLLTVLQEVLRSALLLLLLLVLGPRVLWLVIATVIAETAYATLMALRGARLLPTVRFRRASVNPARARMLLSFGLWTILGQLGSIVLMNSGVIVLNLFSTAANVTAFHIGAMLYTHVHRTMLVALRPLQPILTAMNARQNDGRFAEVTLRGGRYACWAGLALATPLAIYAEEFMWLFAGDPLRPMFGVIVLFMGLLAITRPSILLPGAAIAKAQIKEFNVATFAVMLAGVGSMAMAGYAGLDAGGVAAALLATSLLGYVFFFWPLLLKLLGIEFRQLLRKVALPGVVPAMAGGLIWLMLKASVQIDGWGMLMTCSIVGGAVYLATLLGLCLTQQDRDDLRDLRTSLSDKMFH